MLPTLDSNCNVQFGDIPFRLPSRLHNHFYNNIYSKSVIEKSKNNTHMTISRAQTSVDHNFHLSTDQKDRIFNSPEKENLRDFSSSLVYTSRTEDNLHKPIISQLKKITLTKPITTNFRNDDIINLYNNTDKLIWIGEMKKWINDNSPNVEFLKLSTTAPIYGIEIWHNLKLKIDKLEEIKDCERFAQHFKSKSSKITIEKNFNPIKQKKKTDNTENQKPNIIKIKSNIENIERKTNNEIKKSLQSENLIDKDKSRINLEKLTALSNNNIAKYENTVNQVSSYNKVNEESQNIFDNNNMINTIEKIEQENKIITLKSEKSDNDNNKIRNNNIGENVEENENYCKLDEISSLTKDISLEEETLFPEKQNDDIQDDKVKGIKYSQDKIKLLSLTEIQPNSVKEQKILHKKKKKIPRLSLNKNIIIDNELRKSINSIDNNELEAIINPSPEIDIPNIFIQKDEQNDEELPPLPDVIKIIQSTEIPNEIIPNANETERNKCLPLLKNEKPRWGKKNRDLSYSLELENENAAELRKYKIEVITKRKKERKGKEISFEIPDGPRFETYGFLSKYCILKQMNVSLYRGTFDVCDEDKKQWLNKSELMMALKGVNPKLKDYDIIYLNMVMNTCGYNLRLGADFKLFAVLAALSIQITTLDSWIKNYLGESDFKFLEKKTYFCRKLWEVNVDQTTNTIPISKLCVELKAGGVKEKHIEEVKQRLGWMNELNLLDFFTYIPLFILMHSSIIDNPLDNSEKL